MTRGELIALGLELRRLGWRKHLEQARLLYAGGVTSWSLEHAADLASALGLGDHPLVELKACPVCPPPTLGHWNGTRTRMALPDRWVITCSRCGAEWIQR